jgi:hypothetical protein
MQNHKKYEKQGNMTPQKFNNHTIKDLTDAEDEV